MNHIFSYTVNESTLARALGRINAMFQTQAAAYAHDNTWYNTAWYNTTKTVDLVKLTAASDELADWNIAANSWNIAKIIDALGKANNVFFNALGIEEAGIVDYVALHKTQEGGASPYVHTVLLERMARNKKAYPLFLRGDKVCIGPKPVSNESVQWLDFTKQTDTISNFGDFFGEIQKMESTNKVMFIKFSASYCLDAIESLNSALRILDTYKGFKISMRNHGTEDSPIRTVTFEHETDPELRFSYAFYFREACVKTPHISGVNTGTYHGPRSMFFTGIVKELLEDTCHVSYPKIID